jgi:hypothetical protein
LSSSRRIAVLTIVVGTLIATGAKPLLAQTAFTSPSRISSYFLSFTDFNQFLDASAAYQFTHDVTTATGVGVNIPGHIVTAKSLHTGFFSGATGNATTSHTGPSATNVYNAPWSTTGGGGTISYGYDTPIAGTFGESWIVAGIHNGRYTLDFIGGGSGFAAASATDILFKLVITINGNWSQFGTGFGQVEWLGYTGAGTYSVDKLFTYANGVTTLEMSNLDWNTLSPNAAFRLYGESVVPEPASIVLLATGLLGLGAMHRLRRRRST